MTVLDPFVGSGTTIIAANNIGRSCIGIDLNEEYKDLYLNRSKGLDILPSSQYIVGDSNIVLDNLDAEVDYIVTSPPYHNILRNKSKGTRNNNGKNYRMSARDGVRILQRKSQRLGKF